MKMPFAGNIKIGGFYRSFDPDICRRVTRLHHGCVDYVYIRKGRPKHANLSMPEALFRSFTSHEIDPNLEVA